MGRKVLAIIPARYNSSRLPGKPLKLLAGKPIVCRVVENILNVVNRAIVATDDDRIYTVVTSFGYEAIMTSDSHNSGTERIIEAYEKISNNEEIIINLQGDEPFIRPEQILSLVNAFDDKFVDIATLAEPFAKSTTNEVLFDPSKVKIVKRADGMAMYFSRQAIPYQREVDSNWCSITDYYKHIGLYAFRAEVLKSIKKLPHSTIEDSEKLEQLRWLENGFNIKVINTDSATIGIDTLEDLERAEEYINTLRS